LEDTQEKAELRLSCTYLDLKKFTFKVKKVLKLNTFRRFS